jgi:hypothetical protein
VFGLADQGDARLRVFGRERAHPLGAGAGLAGAAAAENEPGVPVLPAAGAFGPDLVLVRKHREVGIEALPIAARHRPQEFRQPAVKFSFPSLR